jgi:hypothetical protein
MNLAEDLEDAETAEILKAACMDKAIIGRNRYEQQTL